MPPWAAGALGPTEAYIQPRRERFIIVDLANAWLDPSEKLTILVGGARHWANDTRWRGYPRARQRLYGFELDEEDSRKTEQALTEAGIECRVIPAGLGSGPGTHTLYVTGESSASSLYRPNLAMLERMKMQDPGRMFAASDVMSAKSELVVTVDSLNNLARRHALGPVDFMNLNVQGGELEIIKGAQSVLPRVLGAEVEISFVETYVGRPMFSDIDPAMRAHYFEFFELIGHFQVGRMASPITTRHTPKISDLTGQMFEAKAVYLRDPIRMQQAGADVSWIGPAQALKLATIAEIYHQVEFAIEVLLWHPALKDFADVTVDAYRRIMA